MTIVGILGMTHDEEMQRKYQYPLSLVKEFILEFDPDVICGEVHPDSWELFIEEGKPNGIIGETQDEYPNLIFPLCQERGIKFVPVNWFEPDVFDEEPFDKFPEGEQQRLVAELYQWNEKQLATWNDGSIPLNSKKYDQVTSEMYDWLFEINPDVQNIVWNIRHFIMTARVKNVVKENAGKRILCIHGADHNYWYYKALKDVKEIELKYPLR
ncbi:hypothetical protein [Pseudalkalibacillus decolorationis]|uniref:hypothetical protein n=1 Tax=Pseudalkalibacillus decolorationis TaxID=163879 RepID=UPI0021482974|nr:hypothetical protein [Pseudalkalibacillus decolorationis]